MPRSLGKSSWERSGCGLTSFDSGCVEITDSPDSLNPLSSGSPAYALGCLGVRVVAQLTIKPPKPFREISLATESTGPCLDSSIVQKMVLPDTVEAIWRADRGAMSLSSQGARLPTKYTQIHAMN